MKQEEITSTSFPTRDLASNQISQQYLTKNPSRDQELANQCSGSILDKHQHNSLDYKGLNFAFRDVERNIDLLLDPTSKAGERAFLRLPITQHATVANIERLANFCANNAENRDKRREAFDVLLLSMAKCPSYKNQLVDKLISFIHDDTLPLDFRTKSTQALLRTGTKDSLTKCQAIATDSSLDPEIRINASVALNYAAKDILKEFIFSSANSDRVRILALQAFTVLHDEKNLEQIFKIARGENNESTALRLAALQANMFSGSPELLRLNKDIIRNCPANLRIEALSLLRTINPQEMIILAKEILVKTAITPEEKYKILYFLNDSALSKKQTITEYLSEHLGKESTQKFLAEMPTNIEDLFRLMEYKEKPLSRASVDEKLTAHQIISARNTLEQQLKKHEKLSSEFDCRNINLIIKSNQPEDRALLQRILEYPNCTLDLKYQIATQIGPAVSGTVEKLMLQNRSYLEVVDFAEILLKINRSKGLPAFRELIKEPVTFGTVLDKCFEIGDTELIDMVTERYRKADLSDPESRRFLKSLGEKLESIDGRKQFISSILRVANLEQDKKAKRNLEQWAKDLQKCEKLGIEYPLRLKPETLAEIVKNREMPSEELKKDKREVAIICMPKMDFNGFAYGMRDEIENLRSKGYRLMFYEVKSRDSLIESVNHATVSGKAQNLILIGHGTRSAMAFSGNDPGQGHLVNSSNGLTIKDAETLKQKGFGNCLKKNGQILLISCSVGAGAGRNDNLANMMRQVVPQALPKGIVAPTAPTTFEGFIFDQNNNLRDFDSSSDRYKAFHKDLRDQRPDAVSRQQKFAA